MTIAEPLCSCDVRSLNGLRLYDLTRDLGYSIAEVSGARRVYNGSYHMAEFIVLRGKTIHKWVAGFTEDGGMMWCKKDCSDRHFTLGAWNLRAGLQYVYDKGGVGCPAPNSNASTSR